MSNDTQKVEASSLIEAKLSKSEAVKIIISDMIGDLRRAQKNIDVQIQGLEKVGFDEIAPVLKGCTFRFTLDSYSHEPDGKRKYFLSLDRESSSQSSLPPVLKARFDRLLGLHKEAQRIRTRLEDLSRSREDAQVLMLKSLLEQTEEGKSLLASITAIRKRAAISMGAAVDTKLLSGK